MFTTVCFQIESNNEKKLAYINYNNYNFELYKENNNFQNNLSNSELLKKFIKLWFEEIISYEKKESIEYTIHLIGQIDNSNFKLDTSVEFSYWIDEEKLNINFLSVIIEEQYKFEEIKNNIFEQNNIIIYKDYDSDDYEIYPVLDSDCESDSDSSNKK